MPRTSRNLTDPNLLEATLEGLLLQKQRLDTQIQEVRAMLNRRGSHAPTLVVTPSNGGAKRELSASARRRIAAAQKKRWAEYRKQHAKAE